MINYLGDQVRIHGVLYVNDVPTDPTTLRLVVTDPTGSDVEYEWSVDPEIVRDSVGRFYFDLLLTQRGVWSYSWFSNSNLTAFASGQFDVADVVVLTATQEASGTTVPFVSIDVRQIDTYGSAAPALSEPARTDSAGQATVQLPDGQYQCLPRKVGWLFNSFTFEISGDGPHSVSVVGKLLASSWLRWEDLELVVDSATIDRLFNDRNTSVRDAVMVEAVMQGAEALAESKLLRSWTSTQIANMAGHDAAMRAQAAWIAVEMASERKQEFIAGDGKGRYWAQYERAISYFDGLSKSKDHSRGEVSNRSANTGGDRQPEIPADQTTDFVFAADRNGFGQGGF